MEHESDGSHGKIYGLIKNEIYRVLTKLAHLPYGLILISHSQDRDLETRTGTVTRTVPTLSESFRQIVIGLVDLILYCDVQIEQAEDGTRKYRRVVRTKPSPHYEAGDRTGRLPETIDLNFQAFIEAFNRPAAAPRASAPRSVPAPGDGQDKKPAPAGK